jgi:hypothetical protein
MHWSEELGKWIEKKTGQMLLALILGAVAAVVIGFVLGVGLQVIF